MNLPPVLRQRYLDANGLPLAGGKLYSYQAGTSTLQNTYTDQGGLTPNANPLVLDAQGYGTMWLDPTLSYKFILQDSGGVQQWSIDNVVGILTANAVATISIADGAVTSAKLGAGAVNSAAIQSDASIDANRPISTNNIKDGAITRPKINSAALQVLNLQKFTATGAGTYNPTYVFFVSSANATVGATYTNNAQTFTVVNTISAGTVLQATGASAPTSSGTLTKTGGTGDATITYSAFVAPIYARVRMAGGGGGGAGGGNTTVAGGAGGDTTFGSNLTAHGGATPVGGGNQGGSGGSAVIAAGMLAFSTPGASGQSTGQTQTGSYSMGGQGGATPFSGGGSGGGALVNGGAAPTNSGAGGGGGGTGSGTNNNGGPGGGAGAYIEAIIASPTSTSLSVGTGGTAGAAGTAGQAGGAGAAGFILIEEHFQ